MGIIGQLIGEWRPTKAKGHNDRLGFPPRSSKVTARLPESDVLNYSLMQTCAHCSWILGSRYCRILCLQSGLSRHTEAPYTCPATGFRCHLKDSTQTLREPPSEALESVGIVPLKSYFIDASCLRQK